jgi:hypothetical protein
MAEIGHFCVALHTGSAAFVRPRRADYLPKLAMPGGIGRDRSVFYAALPGGGQCGYDIASRRTECTLKYTR